MIKAALLPLTGTGNFEEIALTAKAMKEVNKLCDQLQEAGTAKNRKNNTGSTSPILLYGTQTQTKIATAAFIGRSLDKTIYRIDLSKLVSKYVNETEKNLAAVFDAAEKKDWILFFDEADALFGKRTDVKDSHDKYANLDVNYLLQRIETFDGVILLAGNKKSKIDPDVLKKLTLVIHFPKPKRIKPQ